MSLRTILTWPNPCLSQVCAPADDVDAALIGDMFDTMYDAPGRGLAAPQIGVMKRIFVMDVGWKDAEKTPLTCINPRIIAASETLVSGPEGCLSMPAMTVNVTRPAEITLEYSDIAGTIHQTPLSGFAAICAQHELDHLDGKMHFDHLSPPDRVALFSQYEALP